MSKAGKMENNRLFRVCLYALCAVLLTAYAGHGLPVETVPDEASLLKNVYGMMQFRTIALVYPAVYSVWAHLVYLPLAALYWGVWLLGHMDAGVAGLTAHALNHYLAPVWLLRAGGALFYLASLILATRVVDRALSRAHGLLFFILCGFNLLTVVLAHTAKQWLPGFAFLHFAYWFYWLHKERPRPWAALAAGACAMVAVFTVPPLVVFWIFFLLLHFRAQPGAYRALGRDLLLFGVGAAVVVAVTAWLGMGSNVSSPGSDFKYGFHPEFFAPYMDAFLDLAPLAAIGFFLSLPWAAARGGTRRDWGVHPALAGLLFLGLAALFGILLSLSNMGNYYAYLFAMYCALPATLLPARLAAIKPPAFSALVVVLLGFSLFVDAGWLRIISQDDTRQLAADFLESTSTDRTFVLYDGITAAYLPYASPSLRFMQKRHPQTLGFRERAHLKYHLENGINSFPLHKVSQGGVNAVQVTEELLDAGWDVVLAREIFGRQMNAWAKSPWLVERLKEEFAFEPLETISPYCDDANVDETRVGDVTMNFRDPYYTMAHVCAPGPRIELWRIYKKP